MRGVDSLKSFITGCSSTRRCGLPRLATQVREFLLRGREAEDSWRSIFFFGGKRKENEVAFLCSRFWFFSGIDCRSGGHLPNLAARRGLLCRQNAKLFVRTVC